MEALGIMAEQKVGSLVVQNGDEVVGIFTERDHVRKVGLLNRRPADVKIEEVMTADLITVQPSQSVRECMEIMTESRVRHLPVFEDSKMIGLISIGDVVRDLVEELEFLVEQLQNYITGLR
jgi:CBS domain-containing protein